MAAYIKNALIQGEQIVYEGKVSWWSLAPLILLGFLFLFLFGVGLIFWLAAFIRYNTVEVAVTNKRVIAKFGFIGRRTVEMNIGKVESVQVNQSIFGRIFNFGSLIISSAGNAHAPISDISNPLKFRRAFMETQDQAIRYRVRTELGDVHTAKN